MFTHFPCSLHVGSLLRRHIKDVANGEECKYPGHCTFAYCQEEIDVWTLERKGFISRDLLCDPSGSRASISLTVSKILQEHQGIFLFLCEVSSVVYQLFVHAFIYVCYEIMYIVFKHTLRAGIVVVCCTTPSSRRKKENIPRYHSNALFGQMNK